MFLWHFPSSRPDRTLSCTLPGEARTFLPRNFVGRSPGVLRAQSIPRNPERSIEGRVPRRRSCNFLGRFHTDVKLQNFVLPRKCRSASEPGRRASSGSTMGDPSLKERSGGDDGTRTRDPLHAKQMLYQLSYIPKAVVSAFVWRGYCTSPDLCARRCARRCAGCCARCSASQVGGPRGEVRVGA